MEFPIIEKFLSIDGEGPTAGRLAVFIRFQGCNLRCSWCDTTYSFAADNITECINEQKIYRYIKNTGALCVTLTGGEPLIQPGIESLLSLLDSDPTLETHIETNGSVDIAPLKKQFPRLSFVVDYKLDSSGMTSQMHSNNLQAVTMEDAYKFVIGSQSDLQQALAVISEHHLCEKTQVFFSPVLGQIEPAEIVEFMKAHTLNRMRLQLQLHKVIWNPEERGV